MCLMCVEVQKGKLTAETFLRNFSEISDSDPEHSLEIQELIEKTNPQLMREVELEIINMFIEKLGSELNQKESVCS